MWPADASALLRRVRHGSWSRPTAFFDAMGTELAWFGVPAELHPLSFLHEGPPPEAKLPHPGDAHPQLGYLHTAKAATLVESCTRVLDEME
ncbi:DUF7691 family protein [Actinomycetota bacterium Odt1-20B]